MNKSIAFAVFVMTLSVLAAEGCDAVLGLKRAELWVVDGSGGGQTTTSVSSGTSSGTEGMCTPGNPTACYSGPTGTEGLGVCKGGMATCNADGGAFGVCMGEVTPQPATCATTMDLACLGHDNCVTWAEVVGGGGNSSASGIALDSAGNSYVVGSFGGVVQLPSLTLTAVGDSDVYVIKLNPSGMPIWGRSFGTVGAGTFGSAIAVDKIGNVAFGGTSISATSFDAFSVSPGMFVAELEPTAGKVSWAQSLSANVLDVGDVVTGVAFTSSGDVIVGGKFTSKLILGDTPTAAPPGGLSYGFVGRMSGVNGGSTTANNGWAKALCATVGTSNPSCEVMGVRVVAMDNILVGGDFQVSMGSLLAAGKQDAYIGNYTAAGGVNWEQQIGGSNATVSAFSLAAGSDGGPVLSGNLSGTATVSLNPTTTISSSSTDSAFVVHYGPEKTYAWSEVLGCGWHPNMAGDLCYIDGVASDESGNVFLAGQFTGSLSLPGSTTPLVAPTGNSLYVAKVSSTPALLWAKTYGPTDAPIRFSGADVMSIAGTGVAVTVQGAPVVFGSANASIKLDWVSLNPTGAQGDAFVAELSP